MAVRPIFLPAESGPPFVKEQMIDFQWHPGFAQSQTRKSIASLHAAAVTAGISPVLEISSKSMDTLGIKLSAFNLMVAFEGRQMSVECAFQGSKVFQEGGPFTDLYAVASRDAKRDSRLRTSGRLIEFRLFDIEFPLEPVTAFYDWLYILALSQNTHLASELLRFQGFTDIAFNPTKSFSCQAHSAALWVSLSRHGLLEKALLNPSSFLSVLQGKPDRSSNLNQMELFQFDRAPGELQPPTA